MGRIATIGFFDGVHAGHRYLFDHLRAEADQRGLQPMIITFDSHPRTVLQSDYVPQLLTSPEERYALLSQYGEVAVLPFRDVQPLTADQFMQLLQEQYAVSAILMGYDHQFGSDRLRRIRDYRAIGAQYGIEVIGLGEYVDGEWHVSSTEIRAALATGNILVANELLGRPYTISGHVVHGKAIGRSIGYPTANIIPDDPCKIIPKPGVYAARVHTPLMDNAPAFVNIDTHNVIEAHIPSFKGDLYDQCLELQFMQFLREEKQFDSLEDLREQIKADIDSILRRE